MHVHLYIIAESPRLILRPMGGNCLWDQETHIHMTYSVPLLITSHDYNVDNASGDGGWEGDGGEVTLAGVSAGGISTPVHCCSCSHQHTPPPHAGIL